ncbi:MAG: SMP-30/gluconolactonase/LRE family protein [Acidobacteria bacterium]|nr:SMP-30/gluconolactonase/LRE family protein [Acidobacteriota bacterium]
MRKVIAYLLTSGLLLSSLVLPGFQQAPNAYGQAAAPVLKGVHPDIITVGSDSFTLRVDGSSFADGAKILFDGQELSSPRIFRKHRTILAELEASAIASTGTHTVQILNPDGQRSASGTLTVVNREPSLRMHLGGNATQEEAGTDLLFQVTGEGFDENSTAVIWGFPAEATTFINSQRLTVQISGDFLQDPATIPIYILNKGGKISNTENFFVVPRPAKIGSIDPEKLDEGNEDFLLTVRGDFKATAFIVVNGTRITTTQRKEGRLEAMIPASFRSQPGQLIIRVEQDGVQSRDTLLPVAPAKGPFIFNLAPSRIRIGENKPTVDVYGTNFNDAVTATIDGQAANIRSSTKTVVTIVVPEALRSVSGTHTIQIKDKDGNLSQTASFEIVPDYQVATAAGDGREGFALSGCLASEAARFRRPRRIAAGPDNLLYITDQQNHAIRTLNPTTGEVCTVAGTGDFGYHDTGNSANKPETFSFPNGVAVTADGTIYVTENGNDVVRRIVRTASGVRVDTVAGTTEAITQPARQAKLNATKEGIDGFREGAANNAAFRKPDEIVAAPDGSLYFTDTGNHAIRRLVQNGAQFVVETIAGNGVPGFIDGDAAVARFNIPTGLALSPDGSLLYVTDTANNRIRRINLLTHRVDTLAGSGDFGSLDGPGSLASFGQPIGVAVDASGTLWVSEFGTFKIRRVDTVGNVSTVAGTGAAKFRDGAGLRATFNAPRGLAIVGGFLFIADYENMKIRKIALQ